MRVTVTTASGQPLDCAIEGELDITTVEHLEQEIERFLPDAAQDVHIDLSRLRMLDSSGVGCLVGLTLKVRARGGEVTLRGALGQPLAILKLLRLDRDLNLERRITLPWGWAV